MQPAVVLEPSHYDLFSFKVHLQSREVFQIPLLKKFPDKTQNQINRLAHLTQWKAGQVGKSDSIRAHMKRITVKEEETSAKLRTCDGLSTERTEFLSRSSVQLH